jgi:hypothetical protein
MRCEGGPLIGSESLWHPKPMYNVLLYETYHLLVCHVFQWYTFHPFCKVVGCNQDQTMSF